MADTAWALLSALARHGLVSGGDVQWTPTGMEPQYSITAYGEWFLARLNPPE